MTIITGAQVHTTEDTWHCSSKTVHSCKSYFRSGKHIISYASLKHVPLPVLDEDDRLCRAQPERSTAARFVARPTHNKHRQYFLRRISRQIGISFHLQTGSESCGLGRAFREPGNLHCIFEISWLWHEARYRDTHANKHNLHGFNQSSSEARPIAHGGGATEACSVLRDSLALTHDRVAALTVSCVSC